MITHQEIIVNPCSAITKKKKPCPIYVEKGRTGTLCHVHDPNGKFKQQVKNRTHRRNVKKKGNGCMHTWYMREEGIQCTKCLIIWEKDTDE
jgi:ribosomal protein RSM22 (predicted rRNA methylase)